jgi:hypothetical protein
MMTGSQFFPATLPFNTRRTLNVDPLAGPYFTLTQAKNAAQSGDCIIVQPGTYAENKLLKNGVNWFFMPGAIVSYDVTSPTIAAFVNGSASTIADDNVTTVYGIFDDRASGACTCTIGGQGSFFVTNRGFNLLKGTLVVTNVASRISFTGKEIGFEFYRDPATENLPGSRAAVFVSNGVRVDVTAERIYGLRGTTFDTGKLDDVSSPIIWAPNGSGVYWQLADLYVKTNNIEKISAYAVWGDQPAGNNTAAGLYIDSDVIENHMYFDGGATAGGLTGTYNWKTWIVAKEIREGMSYFDYGKHYLTAQKIDCPTAYIVIQGACQLWLNLQKLTNSGASGWLSMDLGSPSGTGTPTVHADILHLESTSVFGSAGVIVNAGELHLRGAYMKADQNALPAVLHAGGSTRLVGFTIHNATNNNAGNNPVKVAGAGLILDGCNLIAPALADSVISAAAQTIKAYSCKTNKAKNVNITVQVDALTVDANVA